MINFIKITLISVLIGGGASTILGPLASYFGVNGTNKFLVCLQMMFTPIFLFPFGDLVTIENGVAKADPPSILSLILINTALYLFLGALIGIGYGWARWLMYGVIGFISLYWLFCIGATLLH